MKKILLTLLLIVMLTGCASEPASKQQDDDNIRLGDYTVEYLGASQCTEEDALGEKVEVLYVDLRYTNNSNEPNNFCYSVVDEAYQDGIQLKEYVSYNLLDSSEELTDIQPGKGIDIKLAYELRDSLEEVELQLHELYNSKNKVTIFINS